MKTLSFSKMRKEFCVGVTEDNEVVFIKMEIGSCNNDYYTITHSTYQGITDAESGEQEARERLEDSEYWKEVGLLPEGNNFLANFIDFERAANAVIANDGWQNVNGSYEYIGDYESKEYYISASSFGASIKDLNKEYKKLLITEEEKDILIQSDSLHLKDFSQYTKEDKVLWKKVNAFIERVQENELRDMSKLIPILLNEEV